MNDYGDTKFLIFAHHKIMLDAIELCLSKANMANKKKKVDGQACKGFSWVRIDGGQKDEERQNRVDKFQTDLDCRFAVLSIAHGGVGLTLTAASDIIFAE